MTRPRSECKIGFRPPCHLFQPHDAQEGCEVIELTVEEAEALRLKNIKDLDQTEAAAQMGISQSTFQRILTSAHKKMSEAIIYGKSIKICGAGK